MKRPKPSSSKFKCPNSRFKASTLKSFCVLLLPLFLVADALGQGTAFTYQGQLQNNGSFVSGTFNLEFSLYTNSSGGTAIAGPVTTNGVLMTNGLFTVNVDFGSAIWNGATNWLQIGVESNGATSFSTLIPRQQVTPSPYAIFAEGADAAGLSGTVPMSSLSGTYGGALNLTNTGNSFSGNGGGLTNLNAASLGGLSSGNFWQSGGNSGVPTGSNYIGNNDNQYLDIHANGVRVFRLRLLADGLGIFTNAPNILGGSSVNLTAANVVGAVIGGGGGNDTSGGAHGNDVQADFGAIGGGLGNTNSGIASFIGGGGFDGTSFLGNSIQANAAVIGGGVGNSVPNGANYSVVGGGYQNSAGSEFTTVAGGGANSSVGVGAVIGGGFSNSIPISGTYSFIGGGDANSAGANAAVIGGGQGNVANGPFSIVAGGSGNVASGELSTICGGGTAGSVVNVGNIATGSGSFIGGGGFDGAISGGNASSGGGSVICGGVANTNSGTDSVIAGGLENSIPGGIYSSYAFIGGGVANTNSGVNSVIVGGISNIMLGLGSFIGGGGYDGVSYAGNYVNANAAVICGGFNNSIPAQSRYAFIGGGNGNEAGNFYATVAGGNTNVATGQYSTIAGGDENVASGGHSTVGGGYSNAAGSGYATIAGGYNNTIQIDCDYGTIAGGYNNNIQLASDYATISGGYNNAARGEYSIVLGGISNAANATVTLAAGHGAIAHYPGSFVWSDHTGSGAEDTGLNQFVARASGGFYFYTASGSTGATLASGATSWTAVCDRNAKKNFEPVDTVAVLNKLAAVPIEQWNYKWEKDTDTPNIGPMAQDFKKAFYPGRDDKGITTLEFDGVELAAIQGLNQKLEETEKADKEKDAEIAVLSARLEKLEQLVNTLKGDKL